MRSLFLRPALAWGVHLFTASGAVWGLLSILAIFERNWRAAIIWMILAVLVDGFDGMLARWADVKTYAPGIDGALLDNILDYLNYVLVPALFLTQAEALLPAKFRLAGGVLILLASAYQFTQSDAKTDDYYFKGFPSYWNIMVLYMLVLGWNPWLNLALLVFFALLVFVPVKYIYPSRNTRLRQLTLILTYLYAVLGIWAAMQYPHVPVWAVWVTLVYVAYYAALSLWPRERIPEHA
ncbi:MAG: CDP-alcohol phosphatidyltransferase family protein [Anaerolineales bacterium]